MTTQLKGILLAVTTFFYSEINAQESTLNLLENRAALREYTIGQLERLKQSDRKAFKKVDYYYTQSFEAAFINCDNCALDLNVLINRDLFNVREFENLRPASSTYTFEYLETYVITLKSLEEVDAAKDAIDQGPAPRPLPVWNSTGDNQQDYANYKADLHEWIMDFPEDYRTLTSSGNLMVMKISDFAQLEPSRKEIVLNNSNGYLIVD
jgi:hypothetical protein